MRLRPRTTPASPERRVLARDWQVWAAENLLRGVSRAEIEARLVAEGVDATVAKSAVDALVASPFVEAAAPLRRGARRFAMATRREAQLRSVMTSVPRIDAGDRERIAVHYASGTPAIVTGLVATWPCFGKASPRALAERFGDVEVEITCGRDDDPHYEKTFRRRTERITMRALAERIEAETAPTNDYYLVATNRALERTELGALLDEIVVPPWMDAASVRRREAPSGASLWMGPAGTVTPLHHDFTNLLFCALHGRKRSRLVPPLTASLLERVTAQHTLVSPDALPAGTPVLDVVVGPGEALFLPIGWWHHVTALDASVGLSLHGFPGDQDFGFFRPGDP